MQLSADILRALEEGLLPPSEAAEAISVLLSAYSPQEYREIIRSLGATTVGGVLTHSASPQEVGSISPPHEGVLGVALERGVSMLAIGDPRLAGRVNFADARRSGSTIVVFDRGAVRVPDFQFQVSTSDDSLVQRFVVRQCNRTLLAGQDPWGALSWWVSSNAWIDGKAPLALLDTRDERDLSLLASSVAA